MELFLLEVSLLTAVFTSLGAALLGYSEKKEMAVVFLASVVSVMPTLFAALYLSFVLARDFAFIIPAAILLEFVLIALAFGFSWKLLLKMLIANIIAVAVLIFTSFIWLGCSAISCISY